MLGDSSADETPAVGAPSRRKPITRKSGNADMVSSKALDSDGIQRLLNRESSLRECRDEGDEQMQEFVGRALVGEIARLRNYEINAAEKDMSKAGVGLHVEEGCLEAWASDDVTGGQLDPGAVRAARKEEMQFIKGLPFYEEATVEECWRRAGKAPILTK